MDNSILSTEIIKKALYKEKPKAKFLYIRKGTAYYEATIGTPGSGVMVITFYVPVSDMGDADFLPEMEAKHLIRYM
jgi:hypothetical protein